MIFLSVAVLLLVLIMMSKKRKEIIEEVPDETPGRIYHPAAYRLREESAGILYL